MGGDNVRGGGWRVSVQKMRRENLLKATLFKKVTVTSYTLCVNFKK